MRKVFSFFLISVVLALGACSRSKVIRPIESGELPVRAIIKPLKSDVELTRENVAAIEEALLSALRNRGYFSRRIVAGEVLGPEYGLVELNIESFERQTILAGHVNYIAGNLKFLSARGQLLTETSHSEAERGGLLFNTGQVLKGLRSEVSNFKEDAFTAWVQRFADKLAKTLPKPKSSSVSDLGAPPKIESTELKKEGRLSKVCAQGTPELMVTLKTAIAEVPLREQNTPGQYCVILPSYFRQEDLRNGEIVFSNMFGIRDSKGIVR